MNDTSTRPELPDAPSRVPTGIDGLDAITRGGLFHGGIYIIAGRPGAGKTILSNQLAFAHVRNGGRVVYATLLAETHGRLLQQIRPLAFFDDAAVGRELLYLNALKAVVDDGLDGLLQLVRSMVRDHKASLLVLDGMVTAAQLAKSQMDFRNFISELQTWVAVVGCTVVLVTSAGTGGEVSPEHTMVDGIVELSSERVRMRVLRHISVPKFRGSGVVEGQHAYVISDEGLKVFPRIEAEQAPDGAPGRERLGTGVPGLDELMDGGLVPGSTTLVLGSSGAGKTIMGMQFLAAGAARGERGLHFGFYESPSSLVAKARRLGLSYAEHAEKRDIVIRWQKPAEPLLDAVGYELLELVERENVKRVFIDGFVGFRTTAYPDRVSNVFSSLAEELLRRGVTTLITDETRELFIRDVEVPTQNVSAIFHNILFVRQVEQDAVLRNALWVMKVRDSAHDRRGFAFEVTHGGVRVSGPFEHVRPDDQGSTHGAVAPTKTTKVLSRAKRVVAKVKTRAKRRKVR